MTQTTEARLKYYSVITGFFCAVLLLTNAVSAKLIDIGPLTVVGGTLLFPIAFIFNDILTEVYGFRLTRKVIWTGLGCQLLAIAVYAVIGAIPPAAGWPHQDAFTQILGSLPRITFASVVAYFCGEFANSVVLSRMKYAEHGARGWREGWRFVASTIVGEGVDSVVFMTVAFLGVLSSAVIVHGIVSIYILKVAYEIVATPVSTRVANWLKTQEGVDVIDEPTTNYSPFAVNQ